MGIEVVVVVVLSTVVGLLIIMSLITDHQKIMRVAGRVRTYLSACLSVPAWQTGNVQAGLIPRAFPQKVSPHHTRGFTLMELLVVITIITVLAAIILPSLQKARRKANFVSKLATTRGIDRTGCVAYWLFGEGGGITTKDITETIGISSSGGGNDATIYGPKWVRKSRHGRNYCLEFDGQDDYVAVEGKDASLSPGANNFSIEVWFKTSNDYSGVQGTFYNDYGSNLNNTVFLGVWTDNKLYFSCRDSDGDSISITGQGSAVNDGEWHHAVGTRNGNRIYLYLDRLSIGTDSKAALGTIDLQGGYALRIGRFTTGYIWYFDGLIDEAAFYKSALTEDEVRKLYELSRP